MNARALPPDFPSRSIHQELPRMRKLFSGLNQIAAGLGIAG